MTNRPIPTDRADISLDTLYQQTADASQALLDALHAGLPTAAAERALSQLVDALPLAQQEYTVLRCRLTNAANYRQQGELAAAIYEVDIVNRRLRAIAARTLRLPFLAAAAQAPSKRLTASPPSPRRAS